MDIRHLSLKLDKNFRPIKKHTLNRDFENQKCISFLIICTRNQNVLILQRFLVHGVLYHIV